MWKTPALAGDLSVLAPVFWRSWAYEFVMLEAGYPYAPFSPGTRFLQAVRAAAIED
jgi:hypothetical protein